MLSAAGSYAPVADGEQDAGTAQQATFAASGSGSSSSKRGGRPGPSSSNGSTGAAAGGRGGARCPVLVRASIEGGAVEAWGARLPLPIR